MRYLQRAMIISTLIIFISLKIGNYPIKGGNDLSHRIITLSKIITAECGICEISERSLVGSVILNRIDSKHFPNTLAEVIAQKGQFIGYKSKHCRNENEELARRLYSGIGRNYEVLYFYQESAYDSAFVDAMKNRVIIKKQFHNFAK